MLADEERYAAHRANQQGDYQLDGRAGKILRHLSSMSLHFLPQALGNMIKLSDGTKRFEGLQQRATLDRLVDIHETAGEHLHAHNPANVDRPPGRMIQTLQSRDRVAVETAYLKSILWEHYKVGLQRPFDNVDGFSTDARQVWIVSFGKAHEPDVQMAIAEAVGEPDV